MQRLGEVRLNRNFIRAGDTCAVKLPRKTQFRSGFRFVAYVVNGTNEWAEVRDPDGKVRCVPLSSIQRKAQTRNGVRREESR